ncbi:MAG: CRTAC1 family protein [Planctomycetales bacterium]|nr:CRTAC1 family protein [Planctomycetales bacterium]
MTQPSPDRPVVAEEEICGVEQDDAVIGRALRRSLVVFVALAGAVAAVAYWAWPTPASPVIRETQLAKVQTRETGAATAPQVKFTDVTAAAGIRFVHENAAHGEKLLPETMGGGCAFFDFDNDGDQDILLVNSLRRWPWDEQAAAAGEAKTALYQNDGAGNFTDVSEGSGLDVSLYGMGVAVGDYDNDGLVDVFLSALGRNRLFHNAGDGKFVDVTDKAGVGGEESSWSTCCGWLDYDNDGDLDLFVGNYLEWSRDMDAGQDFQLTGGERAYGRPQNFEGALPYFYRNEGDGRFTEIAEQAGLHIRNPATGVPMAKSLGLAFADVDRDGCIDMIVANDTVQNFLFRNKGDGSFEEIGAVAGIAFDMSGNARGAMGIDVARFREGDALGIAIANFANEMTALYVAYGDRPQFMDEAIATGIGPCSRSQLKFGLFFWDYDLDGRLDLFTANGHLERDINRVQPSQHYQQPPHLFWNCGPQHDTEFLEVTEAECGPDLFAPMVGRGAAYADIDDDGDLDLLVAGVGEPARLLRNDQDLGRKWLRIKLTGTRSNRDAIGAIVELQVNGKKLIRQVAPTRSYISQVELPLTFGLGADGNVQSCRVTWPDGSQQDVNVNGRGSVIEVVESTGQDAA